MHKMVLAERRQSVSQVAILITDGQSRINKKETISSATDAKNDGITMVALGLLIPCLTRL